MNHSTQSSYDSIVKPLTSNLVAFKGLLKKTLRTQAAHALETTAQWTEETLVTISKPLIRLNHQLFAYASELESKLESKKPHCPKKAKRKAIKKEIELEVARMDGEGPIAT